MTSNKVEIKAFGLNSQKNITLPPYVMVSGYKSKIFEFLAQKVSPHRPKETLNDVVLILYFSQDGEVDSKLLRTQICEARVIICTWALITMKFQLYYLLAI